MLVALEEKWIYILFNKILNCSHPFGKVVDIYFFQYRFSILVTPVEEGWIYIPLNVESKSHFKNTS